MGVAIAFWALTVLCCAHAATFGEATGRIGSALFLFAVAATIGASWKHGWGHLNTALFLVDAGYFTALWALAVKSRRYWPIWAAGFQALAVVTHIARALDPDAPGRLYRALESVWAIPILTTMTIGIWTDRRDKRGRGRINDGVADTAQPAPR